MDTVSNPSSAALSLARKRALLAELLQQKADASRHFPLSFTQQGLWFLNQLAPDSPMYNIARMITLNGSLQLAVLEQSLSELVRRHQVLRTRFVSVDGKPVQVIDPVPQVAVPIADLAALAEDEREAEAERLTETEARYPFDLARGPLLRTRLLRLGEEKHLLLLTMHHIIADGWSMGIFFRELGQLYTAFSIGRPSPLPELPIQYTDFTLWQREWLGGARLHEQLHYWKEQLADLPQLELPTDRPRPLVQTFTGAYEPFRISPVVAAQLKSLSQRANVTLFMTLLAGFQALLSRYSGQEDIVIGTGIANRTRSELEGLIGFFVNTQVLRTDVSGDPTVLELLWRVREVALGAYAHQDVPFEQLVEELHPQRDPGQNPLFQVIIGLHNASYEPLELAGLTLQLALVHSGTTKFDIHLSLWEEADELNGLVEYSTDLFEIGSIRRMVGHYKQVLAAMAAQPEQKLSQVPLLTVDEQEQLHAWNATATAYPQNTCIHEIFEQQVKLTPEAIALCFEHEAVTYALFNGCANQLARSLCDAGVQPGDLVGIYMERSLDLITSMVATLKAGAAYVPLDLTYPQERVAFMMQDTQMKVLLTQSTLLAQLPEQCAAMVTVLCLDNERVRLSRQSVVNLNRYVSGQALAYVIYTSGSTGIPKGVAIPQRAITRLVLHTNYIQIGTADRIAQASNTSFDAATFEVWGALLNGAQLIGVSREMLLVPLAFAAYVQKQAITALFLTTALFNQMAEVVPESFRTVRTLLIGGEAITPKWVRTVLAHGRPQHLLNVYGPTENTTFSTWYPVEAVPEDVTTLPIGSPLTNTYVYVLDQYMQLVPVGIPGELYLGGDGLAHGYLNRPDVTAEHFVPDPFSREPGAYLYKTGDSVRYLPGGALEFLRRLDTQVKLRGFRVELGEVETILNQYLGVRDCVVTLREDEPGNKRLVAYIVPDVATLQAHSQQNAASLSSEHVTHWQIIFDDHIYGQAPTPLDPTFHIVGWNSSSTGLPTPEPEMQVWLDDTIATIQRLRPKRVLEIGCGTGLLLFRIAPQCERYYGTDISTTSLTYLHQQLRQPEYALPQVSLLPRVADDFSGFEPGSFDTIILNSVVQYFPSVDYLLRVLEGALGLLTPGGHLFIGDVRSLPLLEVFHTSLQLEQASASLVREEVRTHIQRSVREEDELTLDPAFFTRLVAVFPAIDCARILPKRGRYHNELSQYRYQVILRVNTVENATPALDCTWLDWQESGMSLERLRTVLAHDRPQLIALAHVPNARLEAVVCVHRLLSDKTGVLSLAEVRAQASMTRSGVEPDDVWELADMFPYDVAISWARHTSAGRFDVLLRRRGDDEEPEAEPAFSLAATFPLEKTPRQSWRSYANWPLQASLSRHLLLELRPYVQERLPDYMVPSAWVLLDHFPLTPNGKLDRKMLPAPDDSMRPELTERYLAPRTPLEELLVHVWSEVLGVSRVGIHDDFFALGGHSLLATQVIVRLREMLQRNVSLRSLFEFPTVAALARIVLEEQQEAEPGLLAPPILWQPRPAELPLSFAQERLWFLAQLEPESPVYTIAAVFALSGPVQTQALEQSFAVLLRRHEALRTRFTLYDGHPIQHIDPALSLPLFHIDLTALAEHERGVALHRLAKEEILHPFDLAHGPLLRITLVHIGRTEHALLVLMNHIISDGWSLSIFFRELSHLYTAYTAYSTQRTATLPDLPIHYADYTLWQRDWLKGDVLQRQLAYWKKHLANLPHLALPTDFPRPPRQRFKGGYYRFHFSSELTLALKRLSQRAGVTLFMSLLAGFAELLARYSGQHDVVIGTPIANRMRSEVENLIGLFVNTLVLRCDLSGDPTVQQMLQRVRHVTLEAYAHQDVPFEKLVEELRPERSLGANPLFQVMFALQNAPASPLSLSGVQVHKLDMEYTSARFDLFLNLYDEAAGLSGGIEYDRDLFREETITRLIEHYQQLLTAMVGQPEQRIATLSLLTDAERTQLHLWNATAFAYPRDACLHELFEAQVARTPDAVALLFDDQQLTYHELNRRANQLAYYLRSLEIAPEVLVGVFMERSLEVIVALLAILKAGGAYLPLDPAYPAERLAFMLADAQVPLLLTQEYLLEHLAEQGVRTICLEQFWSRAEDEVNPSGQASAANLAYVMYTSGSTGTPKGVSVTHRNVVRLVKETTYASLTSEEVFLQLAPISFDASTLEVWGSLLNGARLVIFPPFTPTLRELALGLEQYQITTLWLPAGLFHQMVEHQLESLQRVRQLLAGGDVLSVGHVSQVLAQDHGQTLINGYGPTENTTFTCCYPMRTGQDQDLGTSVPIGQPIANTQVYIVDGSGQLLPVGASGELYIGGAGLARGYLNRPDLTAERFVPHPYSSEPGARLYHTGDHARYRSDGNLEFLGRGDRQVKVRGFRVELAEIEETLYQHPSVRETVVLLREDIPGDKRLVAYIVANNPSQQQPAELQRFLKAKIPEYMYPAIYIFLDALPLTANGKVDRSALPPPNRERGVMEDAYVAPRNPIEEVLADIWASVLVVERVGINDNFFAAGGHSLLAIRLLTQISQAFQVELSVHDIFEAPTVAEQAAFIVQKSAEQVDSLLLATLLNEITHLSEEETQALLADRQFADKERAYE